MVFPRRGQRLKPLWPVGSRCRRAPRSCPFRPPLEYGRPLRDPVWELGRRCFI
uniref:Uncharacterized protein n=1 Tax=Setaria italica TaxID=4555 RepID=K3Z1D8_SETIT